MVLNVGIRMRLLLVMAVMVIVLHQIVMMVT